MPMIKKGKGKIKEVGEFERDKKGKLTKKAVAKHDEKKAKKK